MRAVRTTPNEINFDPYEDLCYWESPEIVENRRNPSLLDSYSYDSATASSKMEAFAHEPQVEIQLADAPNDVTATVGAALAINYKSVTGSTFVETRENWQVTPSQDHRRSRFGCFRRRRCDALESVINNSTCIRGPTSIPTQNDNIQSEIHFVPFLLTEPVAPSNNLPTCDDSTVESSSTASSAAALNNSSPIIEVMPEIYEQMEMLREMRRRPLFTYRDASDRSSRRIQRRVSKCRLADVVTKLSGMKDDFAFQREDSVKPIRGAKTFESAAVSHAEQSSIDGSSDLKGNIVTVWDDSAGIVQSRHVSVMERNR